MADVVQVAVCPECGRVVLALLTRCIDDDVAAELLAMKRDGFVLRTLTVPRFTERAFGHRDGCGRAPAVFPAK